ncbi:50S ribosomal protein L1 [candidate division TM6 bacterium RIFCSPHIGHO2_12_FULL_32_22]|nr:MAG: 50S ribosomal protein L1 [candidate division TM6 bacterium RIFCSPHIGHO2_12_FULL_32_22]
MSHGKKYQNAREKLGTQEGLAISKALKTAKELKFAKFDESVDVDINLGIDSEKGDQVVRGSAFLPHGTGKKARVIVFAKGDLAQKAKDAGADHIGTDDLVEKINGGWLDFEFAVATPDLMGLVGKVAKVLGPRGLLPNAKVGTVTTDVVKAIQDLKKGQVFFKNDKAGIVHATIGRLSFSAENLEDNFKTLLKAILSAKPSSSKGKYFKKVTISSTMGPGIPIELDESLKV